MLQNPAYHLAHPDPRRQCRFKSHEKTSNFHAMLLPRTGSEDYTPIFKPDYMTHYGRKL
jgi:hypothetical protein